MATLTNPPFATEGGEYDQVFTAPGGSLDLAANTTYVVVVDVTTVGINTFNLYATTLDTEEDGAASGWSIADGGLTRSWNSDGGWTDNANARKLQIRGYAKTAGPNNVPVFLDTALTRSVPENSPDGTPVGAPVPEAVDIDDDDLAYSMEGDDADLFDFNGSTRQIATKTGVTYDQSSYSVTIRVTDGIDSHTVAVTIEFTDMPVTPPPEPPELVSARVNGTVLLLTFDKALADTAAGTPAPGDFEVLVNSAPVTVLSLELSGATVTLTLVAAVEQGDTVSVSYTGNALQNPDGDRTATGHPPSRRRRT